MPKNVESVASSGKCLVALGLLPEQVLEFLDLLGVLGGQVVRLREVVGEVVQLGGTCVRIPDARRVGLERVPCEHPRDAFGLHREPPAVLVHGAVADRLEVLLGAVLGCADIGQRRRERRAVHRLLLVPSTLSGTGIAATSRIRGATSMTWVTGRVDVDVGAMVHLDGRRDRQEWPHATVVGPDVTSQRPLDECELIPGRRCARRGQISMTTVLASVKNSRL
jgi:hypothetical protein